MKKINIGTKSEMTTATAVRRWYRIRLKPGVHERSPYQYARKRDDGRVQLFNGGWAAGVSDADVVRQRYEIVGPVPGEDENRALTSRYEWELNR